jgi:hypothetical protein
MSKEELIKAVSTLKTQVDYWKHLASHRIHIRDSKLDALLRKVHK